jgi:hypothetical protein
MKRWIVNAAERTVLDVASVIGVATLKPGEFFWTGTYADAMAAGARRRLAEEALESVGDASWIESAFVLSEDRIEPRSERISDAHEQAGDLFDALTAQGFGTWREGTGLVVLGRPPRLVMA